MPARTSWCSHAILSMFLLVGCSCSSVDHPHADSDVLRRWCTSFKIVTILALALLGIHFARFYAVPAFLCYLAG
jgi:hypothetical protein